MLVTSEPVTLLLPPPLMPRSKGVHLSGIIRCIATEGGILKPEFAEELSLVDVREITDPTACLRISMGLAWEEWYIRTHLHQVTDHPGEMCVDGIYMTMDGESLDTVIVDRRPKFRNRVHEVKCTYKSTKTIGLPRDVFESNQTFTFDSEWSPTAVGPLTSQWMWMAQAKGYCHGAGTRYATFHVLFVCGDYSFPQRPALWRFHITFTDREIEENWQLMRDYRDHRMALEAGQ